MDDLDRSSNCPLVTVVMPSFSQGRFIRDTIDSALSQDYPNLEYWVIDGGSSDETQDVLKSYGHRLSWVSEETKGKQMVSIKGFGGRKARFSPVLFGRIQSRRFPKNGRITRESAGILRGTSNKNRFFGEGRCGGVPDAMTMRFNMPEITNSG